MPASTAPGPFAPSRSAYWTVFSTVAALGYPVVVYVCLTRYGPSGLAVVLVVGAIAAAARAVFGPESGPKLGFPTLAVLTLVGLSVALREAGFALLGPAALNLGLMAGFGSTLRTGKTPVIERFARRQHADLTPAEAAWCRLWTWIWTAHFALGAITVLALAAAAPLSWWALYTGGIAYLLVGTLVAVEFVLRKRRFGRDDGDLYDRLSHRIRAWRKPSAGGETP